MTGSGGTSTAVCCVGGLFSFVSVTPAAVESLGAVFLPPKNEDLDGLEDRAALSSFRRPATSP